MREQLYIQSGIETKVDNFINKREMAPGMVFRIGTKNYEETIIIGNRQEVKLDESNNIVPSVEEMAEDTTRYAWDRCYDIINPALSLSFQYKMLEDLYELINEKIESNSKTSKMW